MPGEAPPLEIPKRWPLVTQPGNRDETTTKDARLVNVFAEYIPAEHIYQIEQRPGLSSFQNIISPPGPWPGLGVYNWKGDLYEIYGTYLFKNGLGIYTTLDSTHGPYQFQIIRGNPGYLVFGNGYATYYTQNSPPSNPVVVALTVANYTSSNALITGTVYTIQTTGSAFNTVGCPLLLNIVGGVFVATGTVSGTGTAAVTVGASCKATAFVTHSAYVITSIGTTDFTLIGAGSNTLGLAFIATGPGLGTGTATLVPMYFNRYGNMPLAVAATAMVAGLTYVINITNTTNFTLVGAPSSAPGTVFTATGPATGSGIVYLTGTPLQNGQDYNIDTVGTTDFTTLGAASNTVGLNFVGAGITLANSIGSGTVVSFVSPAPNSVKGFAYLDGTLYIMDILGNIWGTTSPPAGQFDNPTNWDPLNVIVARAEPDQGVFLAKQLVYVVAIKQWSTELFYDNANAAGSPLSSVPGSKQPYGCVSPDTVQSINDILFWVANNRTSSPQIVMMKELKIQVISSPAVERTLDGAVGDTYTSWGFRHGGHDFYGVTAIQHNITWVYDITESLWYQWTDANGNYWPIVSITFDNLGNRYAQHISNSYLYYLEGDYKYPTDDGAIFPVDIYTPNFDAGVDRRKTLFSLRFDGDRVPGSTLNVSHSDDDYTTWSTPRQVDLGQTRPMLPNEGTFYRRAYHFNKYGATKFRIHAVDLAMDIGTL